MQSVTIPVSERLVSAINLNLSEIEAAMRREYALKLYREGKLTLGQSAELCAVDVYTFTALASRAGVAVIDYGAAELEDEVADLTAALAR
jgi:predicted HTH domain antitoxin